MNRYIFLSTLLNMSITAGIVILFVLFARFLLRKAPKIFSYVLWYVVLFRLLCPVAVSSPLSLLGALDAPVNESHSAASSIEYIPGSIVHTEHTEVHMPAPKRNNAVGGELFRSPEQPVSASPVFPADVVLYLWGAGFLAMAGYSVISYFGIRRKLRVVVPLRDNIFVADDIRSPFVIGFIRPRIYLPCGLRDREQGYIIIHEQHHIRRLDHIAKALAFMALCIHWFNPLVWLAFVLFGKDMEMSCDEAVIRKVGEDVRADYSASLLALATGRRMIAGTPLAFGEGDTRGRIRNLANWRKPGFWVVLAAVAGCIGLAVCLLTNPMGGVGQEGREDESGTAAARLTLDDVEALAEKGDDLSWEDFEQYSYEEVGSGLYIRRYEVDGMISQSVGGRYVLSIGGGSLESKPMYIYLQVEGIEDIIDIRYENVHAFAQNVWKENSAEVVAYSDLDHDGETENVVVRTVTPGEVYELAVEEGDGARIWKREVGLPHMGWDSIMLYSEDGQDYLVEYFPTMYQGAGNYTCTVFSLEGGKETVKEAWSVAFMLPMNETPEMTVFAEEVGQLLRNSEVLLSTEQGILVKGPKAADSLPQIYPVHFNPDETGETIDGTADAGELSPDAARLPEKSLEMLFASGAGGWGTSLTLQPDGTFTGVYEDSDMGANTTEYPYGTTYICIFSGRFGEPTQIGDYAFSMYLEELTTAKPAGREHIEDDIRYVTSDPYGVADGEEFILYAPGIPADELSEEFRSWWPDAWLWRSGELDQLNCWGLYNVNTGAGFFGIEDEVGLNLAR